MDRCGNCNAPMPEDRETCPYCRAPRGAGGLAREGDGGSARGLEDGLARILTESYLAKEIPLDVLSGAGPGADEGAGFLAPSELRAVARIEDAEPGLADLEAALARDLPAVAIEGIQLSRLVDRSGDDVKVIKRGLLFVKSGKYAEAIEWWALQRERLDATRGRSQLLFLLMEAFTCSLAKDGEGARDAKRRIREHPLFAELRGAVTMGAPLGAAPSSAPKPPVRR
jgi:hypothetical protein